MMVMLMCSIAACLAQQREVTKFLGIPVDGTKSEMIRQLKSKGFTPISSDSDILEGEFNGYNVNVYTVTNNRMVYRIMLADKNNVDETEIKIRFNKLVGQFENNPKYKSYSWTSQRISDDEDISYEMSVNNKRYEAAFYQRSMFASLDSAAIQERIYSLQKERFTPEEIANPTPPIKEELDKIEVQFWDDYYSYRQRSVWFMIAERYGKYYICMYYDNEYNKANGEDL